ncbi:membrane protein, PF09852 family [Leptospira weilii serovar Topaz str. LT2116]|uniref:Membrane protein, PF09852 family n=1 Tax=Leptospira weilii serovar Topaz str. LT2116 TaxID=1088540 RepID=M3GZU5_9LEPT|nr:membrane protein, PF09852 family [Leptospira weilii serovar Topaz str. LT2116]
MSLSVLLLLPFFIFYLPVQYWIGSKGIGGLILTGILLCAPILFRLQKRWKKESFPPLIVSPGILISYWSLFVFTEGIFYTTTALDSFFLGDFDYTAQMRMIVPTIDGKFFQTQYYGPDENANFLSHHMTPGILLLTPFPILFGSELGFGIGIFFSLRSQFPFYTII